jgi:large conductance mechanosensitive channel protein
MRKCVTEFRVFLLRGNLIDLAVGIVIGVAFGALVNAFVKDLITPIIAAIFGKQDSSNLSFTINGSRFLYGDFINALITFLSVAAAMFCLRRQAGERHRGEAADRRGRRRRPPEGLPRVPERDPQGGQALCLLHRRGRCGRGLS